MKKRIMSLILAVVIAGTMAAGAMSASAATFKSGGNTITKVFIATKYGCNANTTATVTAEYLVSIIVTTKVDKNGNKIKSDMADTYAYNAKASGVAKVSCTGTTNTYKAVTCTHGAKYKGYSETASNSTASF